MSRILSKVSGDQMRKTTPILSTSDQCGRDTPDENIYAMVETPRTYGRY
jgi:hypothetical protein